MLFETLTQTQQFKNTLTVPVLSASGVLKGNILIDCLEQGSALDNQIIMWSPTLNTWVPVDRDIKLLFDNNKNVKLTGAAIEGPGTYTPYAWGVFDLDENNVQINSGRSHTVYINQDGVLFCKGDNTYGQLGISPFKCVFSSEFLNLDIEASTQIWSQVECGKYFTVALTTSGKVWSWGINCYGQLARDTSEYDYLPRIINEKNWTKIAAGLDFALAIDDQGYLYGWGRNKDRLLINSDDEYITNPVQLNTKKWKTVECGPDFIVGIDTQSMLFTWGSSTHGQLGTGNTSDKRSIPGFVAGEFGNKTWESVSCGDSHVAALTINKELFIWGGIDKNGVIGSGDIAGSPIPVQVFNTENPDAIWKRVKCGYACTAAIDSLNNVYIWGDTNIAVQDNISFPNVVDLPQSTVSIAQTEITVYQWKQFVDDVNWGNGSYTQEAWQTDNHPVVNISWNDTIEYCKWLTSHTSKNWRLPTINEWEKAAGVTTYTWGDVYPKTENTPDLKQLATYGNFDTLGFDGFNKTSPVGSFPPNVRNIFDLAGNVSEWVGDIDINNSAMRFIKGSSYLDRDESTLKTQSTKTAATPYSKSATVGFRVVCETDNNNHATVDVGGIFLSKNLTTIAQWKRFVSDTNRVKSMSWSLNNFPTPGVCPVVIKDGRFVFPNGRYVGSIPATGAISNWNVVTKHEPQRLKQQNNISSFYPYAVNTFDAYVQNNNLYVYTRGGGDHYIMQWDGQQWTAVANMGQGEWESEIDGFTLSTDSTMHWGTNQTINWSILSNSSIYPLPTASPQGVVVTWCSSDATVVLTDEHPVVNVTWQDAVEYCKWLSDTSGDEWRLPTDSEWSQAVGDTVYPWGSEWPPLSTQGNFNAITNDGAFYTSPVGIYDPSTQGLYDMAGNVLEWMGDTSYNEVLGQKVLRGSAWNTAERSQLLSQYRVLKNTPDEYANNIGFRVARIKPPKDDFQVYNKPFYINVSKNIFTSKFNNKQYIVSNSNLTSCFNSAKKGLVDTDINLTFHNSSLNIASVYAVGSGYKITLTHPTERPLIGLIEAEGRDNNKNYNGVYRQIDNYSGEVICNSDLTKLKICLFNNYNTITSINTSNLSFINIHTFSGSVNNMLVDTDTLYLIGDNSLCIKHNNTAWDDLSIGSNVTLNAITKINDNIILGGSRGVVYKINSDGSIDESQWNTSNTIYGLYTRNTKIVAVGSNSSVSESTDAVVWIDKDLHLYGSMRSATVFNDTLYIVGTDSDIFTNALNSLEYIKQFIPNHVDPGTVFNKIRVLNNDLYIVGNFNTILKSHDGINWNKLVSPFASPSQNIKDINYFNGMYVMCGDNGCFAWSLNGIDWTQQTFFNSSNINCVEVYKNKFVFATSDGSIITTA